MVTERLCQQSKRLCVFYAAPLCRVSFGQGRDLSTYRSQATQRSETYLGLP